MIILLMSTLTHPVQHRDQQHIARKRSHEGSRGHTPQHSSQAEGRDQHTDNGTQYYIFWYFFVTATITRHIMVLCSNYERETRLIASWKKNKTILVINTILSLSDNQWRIQDFLKGGSNSTVAREARAKILKPRPLWGKTTPISIVFERNYQSY